MSDAIQWTAPPKGIPRYFGEEGAERTKTPVPARKASLLPTDRQSHAEFKVIYVSTVDAKFYRRAKSDQDRFHQQDQAAPIAEQRISESTAEQHNIKSPDIQHKYPAFYVWLGWLVFVLIGVGIVLMAFRPSTLAGLGVPVGFTLWAILAYLLRRSDRRSLNA